MRFLTSKQLHTNDHLKAHLGYKSCPRTLGTEELVYGGIRTHDLVVGSPCTLTTRPSAPPQSKYWTEVRWLSSIARFLWELHHAWWLWLTSEVIWYGRDIRNLCQYCICITDLLVESAADDPWWRSRNTGQRVQEEYFFFRKSLSMVRIPRDWDKREGLPEKNNHRRIRLWRIVNVLHITISEAREVTPSKPERRQC